MSNSSQRPQWIPKGAGREYTSKVMQGLSDAASAKDYRSRRKSLTPDQLAEGILQGDRMLLARAITLVESNRSDHQDKARALLQCLAPHYGRSIRVGITGVPGAGKSTLIEALGMQLCQQGHKLAVLAIDPSSSKTGGSILGDKTRMEDLAREPSAFIRPSPSGGTLGGVARKSRETLLLCEAAGFDVVIVETVGVGQSEGIVREMVDFFLLVLLAGAGDELQGMKKGVMELADAIVFNKADGDNLHKTRAARAEMERILHYLQPATKGWSSPALMCSALKKEGLPALWDTILSFRKTTAANGAFEQRRQQQAISWMHSLIQESLQARFRQHPAIRAELTTAEEAVGSGKLPASATADHLLQLFMDSPPASATAPGSDDAQAGQGPPPA